MEKRTWAVIIIVFGAFALWQNQMNKGRVTSSFASQGHEAQIKTTAAAPEKIETPSVHSSSGKPIEIQTANGTMDLSSGMTLLNDWTLSKFKKSMHPGAAQVNLNDLTRHEAGEVTLDFDSPELSYLAKVQATALRLPHAVQWNYEDANVKIKRTLTYSDSRNDVNVDMDIEFKKAAPRYAFVAMRATSPSGDPEERDRQIIYYNQNDKDVTRLPVAKMDLTGDPTKDNQMTSSPVKWIGINSRYFLLALLPQGADLPQAVHQNIGQHQGQVSLIYPVVNGRIRIPLKVYFGAKELEALRTVEPTLDHAVDFGWFTFFAYPILQFMRWLYGFVKNYGLAIILLTLILKLATYPLTFKSMKSMKEMARIQPLIQNIREKYKDDKEALNREMLTLMRSHGYNPMAGCLPMLIQMPVFFALYRVLYSSVELYQAPFGFWIHDLSAKDPFYVTPVLLTVTMFIQQKLSPSTSADPAQQKMMQYMPVMFGVFMITLPSGLTLYMLTNALASIVQQVILNKKLNIPHGTVVPARAR